jgi:ketosteroid isomerase-like protein
VEQFEIRSPVDSYTSDIIEAVIKVWRSRVRTTQSLAVGVTHVEDAFVFDVCV